MKKLLILTLIAIAPYFIAEQAYAQSCDKKSCGPEGTKKEEAAVLKTMRADLQSVVTKMSRSSHAFDAQVKEMTIEKGENDDESLLFLSHAATAIRHELLNKLEGTQLLASLKSFKPGAASTKQQMVANLKREILVLSTQAAKV